MLHIHYNFKMSTLSRQLALSLRRLSTSSLRGNQCWPTPDYGPMEVQRSVLMNGIKVAAAKPLGAVMSACTILFQAGSRFEVDDQLGATHFIRAASSSGGCAYTSHSKAHALQLRGCFLTCTTDRQCVAFTLRGPLTEFRDLKYYLLDTAARCCFNHWELPERRGQVRDDLSRIPGAQRALDLVQAASWRGPLANSPFCSPHRVDSIDSDTLNCYTYTNFTAAECTVASYGMPFEETIKLAEMIDWEVKEFQLQKDFQELPASRCQPVSCPRRGFEYFDLGPGADTWIAVAVPSCGTCDVNGVFRDAVLAAASGAAPVAAGQHAADRAPAPPLGLVAGADVYTHYTAFNIAYADAGLFGVLVQTRAAGAWRAAGAAAEFLAHLGDLDFAQLRVGKARLKLSLARHDEDCARVSEGLALQLACGVQLDAAGAALAAVDCLSYDELCCHARAIAARRGDMAVAVVGDVGAVPHDRELLCACAY